MKTLIFLFFVFFFVPFIFGKEDEEILLFNFTQNPGLNSGKDFFKRVTYCYAKKVGDIGWTYTLTIKDDDTEPKESIHFMPNDEKYPQPSVERLNSHRQNLQSYFDRQYT